MAEMVRVEEAYIEREDASLFYWHKESRNSNAEVDYIVQFRDKVLRLSRRRSNPHHPSLHDR